MERHFKILGSYIAFIAIAHLCLYIALNVLSVELGWLTYFDTQIGLFFAETVLKGAEGTPPALAAWFVEIGLLAIGILMFAGKDLVKVYVAVEGLLMVPYLLFFALIMAGGMSASHGFSPAELSIPTVVVIAGCLLPLAYAIWILRHFRPPTDLSIT